MNKGIVWVCFPGKLSYIVLTNLMILANRRERDGEMERCHYYFFKFNVFLNKK